MAQSISDRRDVQFVLNEQLTIGDLCKGIYADLNTKTFDLLMNEARNLAVKELLPILKECDEEGCKFDNGKVITPEGFKRAWKLFCEGEWLTVADDMEVGGQGMPQVLAVASLELFAGANMAFSIYPMLAHGAGKLVELYGTDKQKELFLGKMYSGEWGGTMCLTEPEAGSDVGALTTTAKDNGDGTYSISGTKIFISAGEQDLTENIIHPVLARIEGSPPGTAGISIFLVPKIWVNDDGSLGEDNDVVCDRIEHKMGIHASATCQLTFGSKGKCRGMLLGEVNKGMRIMFHMMNEERLNVGVQALGAASASYLLALDYARQRIQGKNLLAGKDAPGVPIIQHPDVRRMLIKMKAYVEGLRSLNYYTGVCMDRARIAENDEEKAYWQSFVDILTPVCKGYSTERGWEVTVDGIQVYGGYGYTTEYPMEQIARDCKITTIYEGTTGIQAMDLLGRKIPMKDGKVFMALLGEIKKTVAEAKGIAGLEELAAKVDAAADKLAETAQALAKAARSPKVMTAFANATPFLDSMGDVLLGWMHLWRAAVSAPKLEKAVGGKTGEDRAKAVASNKDAAFYDGQIQTAKYFINVILTTTLGRMDSIRLLEDAPVEMADAGFGG
ncbi:MAG: acyl-CoA dehydrogenase C-terminal domain-containing protein [Deltaproteobacteria bacterium]|nr:acyl-CoA dehydrogenase C-terminal domain-containing protein [Deltaproteobacteria bacterium]